MAFRITVPPLGKKPPVDPRPAAKHFDIVMGLDFHVLRVPFPIFPCPVTPFMALVFDPMDYIQVTIPAIPMYVEGQGFKWETGDGNGVPMGCKTKINGMYRGAAHTALWGMPSIPPVMGKIKGLGKVVSKLISLHFIVPHPLFFLPPTFFHPHEGQLSHGSNTVITEGKYQSTLGCNAYSCQDVGKILFNAPFDGFFLNFLTFCTVVLPFGKPVLIGGPKVEQPMTFADLVNAVMMAGLMKGLKMTPKLLGRLFTKALKKMEMRNPKFGKFRNAVQPHICKWLGEPVEVGSGTMGSLLRGFSLPGPIPFEWEVNYYSDSQYDGPMGKNMYHSYDITLLVDQEDGLVIMNDTTGRPMCFTTLAPGSSMFNPKEKYTLYRDRDGAYYVVDNTGMCYHFYAPQNHDEPALLRQMIDRNGFSINFFYNDRGLLSKIVDSSNRTLDIIHNDAGLISDIYMPHPDLVGISISAMKYEYDQDNRLIRMENAEERSNAFAWQDRLMTARQFADGTTFTFDYDQQGRCIAALGPQGLYSYWFEYAQNLTLATNSLGHTSKYHHYHGIVTKEVSPLGAEKISLYDDYGNIVAESDEIGRSTTYSYDERGNLTEVQLPGQGTVSMQYDTRWNQPIKTVLPDGASWEYTYDEQGNLIEKSNPEGAITTYSYTDGLLQEVRNAKGFQIQLGHDRSHNIEYILFSNGLKVSYQYDFLGRCKVVEEDHKRYERRYNLLGEVTHVKEANGMVHELHYDVMGNVVHAKNKHEEVELDYNFFGDVRRRKQGGVGIEFVYDTEGQLREVINEHREAHQFFPDADGRIAEEISFDGMVRRYLRNEAGEVMRMERPDGSAEVYDYTPAGSIQSVYYDKDGRLDQFDYDVMQRLIRARTSDSEVSLSRDIMGRVVKESSQRHEVLSQYDILGQRVHIGSSLGADIALDYDEAMGWNSGIRSKGWQSTMRRNRIGQETARALTGDLVLEQDYDYAGRLSRQTIGNRKRGGYVHRDYRWDGDRLVGLKDSATGEKKFKHDVHGNLSEILYGDGATEFRMPDAIGNLYERADQQDRQYGAAGKLLKTKDGSYRYDQQGNLIEKHDYRQGTWQYAWNSAGMLEKVIRPDGEAVTFGYDALGRRLFKKYKKTITNFVWDGNKPLHEWKEFDAKDASADELITWVFESDSFAPAAKIKGEKRYSLVCDQLGTPIQGYNEEGSLIWHRELDSYGNARMEKGDAGFCPYLYQGQTLDSETGLAYNRFRYYDPEQGNYISQDPIGLAGGFELYKYVHDPNGWIDVFGLSKTPTRTLQKNWRDYVGSKHTNPDIHHGFPEEFSDRFKDLADIDVNNPEYYYNLPKGKHTKKPGIHTNSSRTGQNWNKTWGGILDQVENMSLSKADAKTFLEARLRQLARKERISKHNARAVKNVGCH